MNFKGIYLIFLNRLKERFLSLQELTYNTSVPSNPALPYSGSQNSAKSNEKLISYFRYFLNGISDLGKHLIMFIMSCFIIGLDEAVTAHGALSLWWYAKVIRIRSVAERLDAHLVMAIEEMSVFFCFPLKDWLRWTRAHFNYTWGTLLDIHGITESNL
jgi:hypothetical protein